MDENKLKNFLINGFQPKEEREDPDEGSGEERIDEVTDDTEDYDVEDRSPRELPEDDFDIRTSMKDLETELIRIRYLVEDLRDSEPAMPDMSQYMTTREQFKSVTAAVSKRDAEAGYKALVNAMEAVSVMREDFFKLCQGMRERIDEMSAETVLSSFEAYSVDMENILVDGGVYISAFPYEKLNTLHQRIVGVIPTGEAEKDGMVAERLSDGYKFGDKVLIKEKVNVYKFDASLAPKPDETISETDSQTDSDTGTEPDEMTSETNQEEEE